MISEDIPLTIKEDLQNKTTRFIDDNDEDLHLVIHSDKKYFNIDCSYTNFQLEKLTHLDKNSRYYQLAKMDKMSCYNGEVDNIKYVNTPATLFKLTVKHGCLFGHKNKYIIMILDNPDYNIDNNIIDTYGKYKLVLYSISKIGMYYEQLIYLTTLTSQ